METHIKNTFLVDDLIMPFFVIDGNGKAECISSMPGINRFSIDNLVKEVLVAKEFGIKTILLFGVVAPQIKDDKASHALTSDNIVSKAVSALKKKIPHLEIITDVCLCAYTDHGHCGILEPNGSINQQLTLKALSQMALTHARAGADWVAPSAMTKMQVASIRKALNQNGYENIKILGYSAKFASNFYGPFREAADSAPKFGDRKGYQLDYANATNALKEIEDDIEEGADMVMVKPALSYLDIIKEAKDKSSVPLAAYNVSGEYALVKSGAAAGFFDERKMVMEILTSIKRAGADKIITYHAQDAARWIKDENK